MSVTTLKQRLVDYLVAQLENPAEDGSIDKTVITTSAKVIKDWDHEIEVDTSPEEQLNNEKLARFMNERKLKAVK